MLRALRSHLSLQRELEKLLAKHKQNISAAAREAKVDRRHFYRLLKKHGLERDD